MAKPKSGPTKLRTKSTVTKRTATATSKKWRVEIIESEIGWGQRLETKTFRDKSTADRFVKKFNSYNKSAVVPDWYMYAREPYQRNA